VREYLFVLIFSAAVTYLLTPVVRALAIRFGALTPVRDRDVHAVPTPRLGGTAMFLGFAAALLVASRLPRLSSMFDGSTDLQAVLLGAGLVCLLGVADDIWGLDAITKLAGQVLAAGIMAAQGVQLLSLPIFGVTLLPTPVMVTITVLVVVVTINAVNFVDGLDGLAAGIVGIAAIGFFAYAYSISKDFSANGVFSIASLVAVALIGCCAGFLPHNFNPARIFMGDSGSMLLGLLLSAATISLVGNIDPQALDSNLSAAGAGASSVGGDPDLASRLLVLFPVLMPIAVLVVPMLDLVLAVVRRTRAGRRPWHPDAEHLHHQLLSLGHSHTGAVVVLYLWTALVAWGVASFALIPVQWALLVTASLLAAAVLLMVRGPRIGRVAERL
jgi:UDP-GlcNAc:undecaprenyl-phosphate GlcNAc-1-phosphate transferase